MAHRDRKTKSLRGSRTHGYGNTQKHRGAGSRGGVGMAGSKKQKWSFVSKYMPGYFGIRGFKRAASIVEKVNSINVGYINENLDNFVSNGIVKLENNRYIINLTDMGYDKLLGSGKATHLMVITVNKCSKSAAEKVNSAGGVVECHELEKVNPRLIVSELREQSSRIKETNPES